MKKRILTAFLVAVMGMSGLSISLNAVYAAQINPETEQVVEPSQPSEEGVEEDVNREETPITEAEDNAYTTQEETEYTDNNETGDDFVTTENTSKFQAVEDTNESVIWEFVDPTLEHQEREITFNVPENGSVRFEMYYLADKPNFVFTSPNGKQYGSKEYANADESDSIIVTRDLNLDEDDINGKVVYLQNAEPGDWKITVEISNAEQCFIIAQTKLPSNWMQLITEKQQTVNKVLAYHIDTKSGKTYTQILKMQDDASDNKFATKQEESEPSESDQSILGTLLSSGVIYIIVILFVVIIGIFVWKKKEKIKDEKTKMLKTQKEYVDNLKNEYKNSVDEKLREYTKNLDAEYVDTVEIDENRDLSPKTVKLKEKTSSTHKNDRENDSDLPPSTTPGRRKRFL